MRVEFNVSEMFKNRDPWDCSNSVANLGDQAARLTWQCATEIARAEPPWLVSTLTEALAWVRHDAGEAGAWDREEIAAWTDEECLAYLVQSVAKDLRLLGSDDHGLEDCVVQYQKTDWDREPEYPIACFWVTDGIVFGELAY